MDIDWLLPRHTLLSPGSGTAKKTAGAGFNPFEASVGALGGDSLRITFPKGAELIADPNVKM